MPTSPDGMGGVRVGTPPPSRRRAPKVYVDRGVDKALAAELSLGGQSPYYGDFRIGGGGGSGRGGGGGSGGYQKYLNALQALRQQAIAQTTQQRDQQLGDLSGLRGSAINAVNRYAGDYNKAIGTAFDQNRQQSQVYQAQLAQMGNQISAGLSDLANPIVNDLQAQGADIAGLQGRLGEAQTAAGALSGAQGTLNTRLAQVMDAARADFTGLGASTQQAARSMAENEYTSARNQVMAQYADALLKLQLMGLGS
jgi:hypothetical protein